MVGTLVVLIAQFVGRVGTLLIALILVLGASVVALIVAEAALVAFAAEVAVVAVGAVAGRGGAGVGVCWDAERTPHSLAMLGKERKGEDGRV